MKRLLALLIPVCFLSISLFGCGSDTTEDTAQSGANGSIIEPEDNMTTGEDMLQDGKNAVDDVVDGAQNAVDDVIDGAQDAIDPNTNQNNSAGTANTTVQTPNK